MNLIDWNGSPSSPDYDDTSCQTGLNYTTIDLSHQPISNTLATLATPPICAFADPFLKCHSKTNSSSGIYNVRRASAAATSIDNDENIRLGHLPTVYLKQYRSIQDDDMLASPKINYVRIDCTRTKALAQTVVEHRNIIGESLFTNGNKQKMNVIKNGLKDRQSCPANGVPVQRHHRPVKICRPLLQR